MDEDVQKLIVAYSLLLALVLVLLVFRVIRRRWPHRHGICEVIPYPRPGETDPRPGEGVHPTNRFLVTLTSRTPCEDKRCRDHYALLVSSAAGIDGFADGVSFTANKPAAAIRQAMHLLQAGERNRRRIQKRAEDFRTEPVIPQLPEPSDWEERADEDDDPDLIERVEFDDELLDLLPDEDLGSVPELPSSSGRL